MLESVLKYGKPVVVAIRDTAPSPINPYTVGERWAMISKALVDYAGLVRIVVIPEIDEICYGRQVGYGIRLIDLAEDTAAVSGTAIRNATKPVVWFTGNSGAGKTTLAYMLKDRMNAVVLDGDEMRASISLGAGFSRQDREEHNLRVARLAAALHRQRHNVIVSVIAPFRDTRAKIDEICHPLWVYVKREMPPDPDKPYEPPQNPLVAVDTDRWGIMECVNRIWEAIASHEGKHGLKRDCL